MFKLFPLDYREYPYIDIKIWEWCPASCTDCKFNIDYIYKAKQFSLENISERIIKVDKLFDKNFWLVFWNQDALNHKDIFNILDLWLSTWREVRFQIWFNLTSKHISLLKNIESRYWNKKIFVKIAQNCRDLDNINERLFILIKILTKETSLNFYLDLFIDFKENKNLINYFHKNFWNNNSDNLYSYNLWWKIELKFHNYNWFLDRKNKCIKNLERPWCQQLDQLYCSKWLIYLKDSLDVYDNWDLFIHDNLCNIGDIRISNLWFNSEVIYNHFNLYLTHLNNIKNNSVNQSEMCYKCVTNWFKYKKV